MDKDYHYVGTELALFRRAQNWKQYLRSQISPYIEDHVLEVGAGIGGTTQTLFDSRASSWTCLEPDCKLAIELQSVVDELAAEHVTDFRVVTGTVETIHSQKLKFDTILYIDVLEHIENDSQELYSAFQ